jgi:hypothetical protein
MISDFNVRMAIGVFFKLATLVITTPIFFTFGTTPTFIR